ncbi:MAG TPA: flagellar protein FliT [Castellaniella sp.]|uniref:flagellar protein FliT n=1 Tax=Castellaniella sp. TaxID=1955812 RepID=UPI002EFFB7F4
MAPLHTPLIRHYQAIAALSTEMLGKAQTQEWDALVELGQQYRDAVEHLKTLAPLDDDQKNARRELLTLILDNDAHIRQLMSPEMDRLSHLLGAFKRQRNVLQAYYSGTRPR